jgi:hypothetical protein
LWKAVIFNQEVLSKKWILETPPDCKVNSVL